MLSEHGRAAGISTVSPMIVSPESSLLSVVSSHFSVGSPSVVVDCGVTFFSVV